jgi:hypothetical protein
MPAENWEVISRIWHHVNQWQKKKTRKEKKKYNAQIRPPGVYKVYLIAPKLIRSFGMYGVEYVIVEEMAK